MRIVIVNAHSCCNLGDAAILMTMIDSLTKVIPNCQVTVVSDTPEKDSIFYKTVRTVGIKYPWEGKRGLRRMFHKISFSMLFWLYVFIGSKDSKNKTSPILQKDASEVIKLIYDSDLIISCGGGYINSLGKLFARMSLLLCSVYYNKPVVLYSQSVSDLANYFDKLLVRMTLNHVDMFISREKVTYNYLKEMGVQETKLKLHADSAFLLQQATLSGSNELPLAMLKCSDTIGMTVTRWAFPGEKNADNLIDNYQRSVREFASYVTNKMGLKLIVFPQVTGPSLYSDDRIFAEEIFEPLDNSNIKVLKEEYGPGQLKSMIGCMSVFVGTRMHSNIFALGARVPTLAIAYQDKTKGIMDMLELGDWVIPINKISTDNLISMFTDLWEARLDLKKKLVEIMPEIEESAFQASSICKEVYEMKHNL